MSLKPILYSYFRSSCSWRVRIALALKKVDYEYRAVNLIQNGGEQFSEEFTKLNPLCQVPAFTVYEGTKPTTLVQSLAILEYLEEKYPEPALLPTDPISKAKVRAICETIVSNIQPLQNLTVLLKVEELGGNKQEWAKNVIAKGFQSLEAMLVETTGKCCVGDEITMADLCLVPQVYNARRFGVDMTSFPLINKICEALNEVEAFKTTHPDHQLDSPAQE